MNKRLLLFGALVFFVILAFTELASAYHSPYDYGRNYYGGYGGNYYGGGGYGNIGYGGGYGYSGYNDYSNTYYKRTTYRGPYKTIEVRRDNPYKTHYSFTSYNRGYNYGYGGYGYRYPDNRLYNYFKGPQYGYNYPIYGNYGGYRGYGGYY